MARCRLVLVFFGNCIDRGTNSFYIRTPSRIKGLIETQIYAQYPQAYVKEVEDYTAKTVDEISEKANGIFGVANGNSQSQILILLRLMLILGWTKILMKSSRLIHFLL